MKKLPEKFQPYAWRAYVVALVVVAVGTLLIEVGMYGIGPAMHLHGAMH